LTVSHQKFNELDFLSLKNENSIIYDVKNFLDGNIVDGSL
jgi:UDP-N-acetyl-D-galactosamine dehydrogenase